MRFGSLVVLAGCGHYGFVSPDDPPRDATVVDQSVDLDVSGDALAASTCPGQGVLLCEGFEAALGSAWTSHEFEGTVGVTGARPFRGVGSLESTTNAVTTGTAPEGEVQGYVTLAGSGSLYGRIWVYAPSPSPAGFNQFMTFAEAGGAGIAVAVDDTGALVSNDFTDGSYLASATSLPLDRWSCVTLEVPRNQTGMTRVYLDDVELTDIAQTNTTAQIALDQVYVGDSWGNGNGLPATKMWFDELIVDTSPITCAQ